MKSSKPRKSFIIDCTAAGQEQRRFLPAVKKEWYLAELFAQDIDVNYFDNASAISDVHSYCDVLSWCLKVLALSESAKTMLREAVEKNWVIALEDLNGGDYCIDVEQRLLILDNNALIPSTLGRSAYFRNVTLITLVRALRDIWQEKRHGGFDDVYKPEHVLLMERVRASDCDVVAVLSAWELRAGGYGDLWRHVVGSENGDIAMIFSGHMERETNVQNLHYALAAAFKQWFRSDARIKACDHDTLEYMDDVMATSDVRNPFGKKKPSKMNIEVLSCLPDKSAYLQGLGADILNDPLYSAMNDVINQTHLFHILYDMEAVMVGSVPFRDEKLAALIFPVGGTPERVK